MQPSTILLIPEASMTTIVPSNNSLHLALEHEINNLRNDGMASGEIVSHIWQTWQPKPC